MSKLPFGAPLPDRMAEFHEATISDAVDSLVARRYPRGCRRHSDPRRWCRRCSDQARADYRELRQQFWDLCNDADTLMYEAGIVIDSHKPQPKRTTVDPPPGFTLKQISERCDAVYALITLRDTFTDEPSTGGDRVLEELVKWLEWAYFGREFGPGERQVDPRIESLEATLACLATMFPWRDLTEPLPDDSLRDVFAGAVQRVNTRLQTADPTGEIVPVDRWWRTDPPAPGS